MIHAFKLITLTLACMATVGASAAQPGNLPVTTLPGRTTAVAPHVMITAPGALSAFKAATAEVVANQPINFKFEGSGYCTLTVSGGDGYSKEFEGQLPFSAGYTYGTGSMSSFETFKDYSASVKPSGHCKMVSALAPISVRVINPTPQGVPTSGSQGAMNAPVMANNKLKLTPATLTSLTLASAVTVGAPTVLVAAGTGSCKFRLTHTVAGTPLASQVMQIFSATAQQPFPMTLKTIADTPVGSYTWTANGIEGCIGSVKLDLIVS